MTKNIFVENLFVPENISPENLFKFFCEMKPVLPPIRSARGLPQVSAASGTGQTVNASTSTERWNALRSLVVRHVINTRQSNH
jgi:hypothetical protein